MTRPALDDALRAANPLPRADAERLPLTGAEHDLLDAILTAEPAPAAPTAPAVAPPLLRRRRPALVLAAATALAATVVAVAGLLPAAEDRPAGPDSAFAAELVRFAEASPLVLLDLPGWKVDYADEQSADEGEMRFTAPDDPQRHATLHWSSAALHEMRARDRSASSSPPTEAPALGTTAQVFVYKGGRPGNRTITALLPYDGRTLELRMDGVRDRATFLRHLAALKRVDADTWLRALPASVIKAADRGPVVAQMLRGVPLPPGFTAADLRGDTLTKDRYQLGALVAGTVACRWFALWGQARERGDAQAEQAAVRAMATAEDWPVLRDMADEGGYTEVLVAFAAAMPTGDWFGRPLLGDVDEGLGCGQWGVDLP